MFARWFRAALAALLLVAAVACGIFSCGTRCVAQQPASEPTPDEQAILDAAASFAEAYSQQDPDRIAAHFLPDGQLVDESGGVQRGHDAIRAVFAGVFEQYPDAQMEIDVRSIRLLAPGVAEEEGVAFVTHEPDGATEENRYVALHLKQSDGVWLLASARDIPPAVVPAAEALEPLAWIIGDWIDESSEALVVTSYQWTENRAFILGQFTVQVAGQPVRGFSQRIGWDPLDRVIRNWVFDDNGGFNTGVWTPLGDAWIIKQTGVTSDGEPASATNTITRLGNDRFQWESRDRVIGGEVQVDPQPVVVVRKPPEPIE